MGQRTEIGRRPRHYVLSVVSQSLLGLGLLGVALGSAQSSPTLSVVSQLVLIISLLLGAGLTTEAERRGADETDRGA